MNSATPIFVLFGQALPWKRRLMLLVGGTVSVSVLRNPAGTYNVTLTVDPPSWLERWAGPWTLYFENYSEGTVFWN